MTERKFTMPVPYVFPDGSVRDLVVYAYEGTTGAIIRDNTASSYDTPVAVESAAHARELARVLMIAANLIEKETGQ